MTSGAGPTRHSHRLRANGIVFAKFPQKTCLFSSPPEKHRKGGESVRVQRKHHASRGRPSIPDRTAQASRPPYIKRPRPAHTQILRLLSLPLVPWSPAAVRRRRGERRPPPPQHRRPRRPRSPAGRYARRRTPSLDSICF